LALIIANIYLLQYTFLSVLLNSLTIYLYYLYKTLYMLLFCTNSFRKTDEKLYKKSNKKIIRNEARYI
jgi:hypothetical protein